MNWLEKVEKEPWECVKEFYRRVYNISNAAVYYVINDLSGESHYYAGFCMKPLHLSLDALREFEEQLSENKYDKFIKCLMDLCFNDPNNPYINFKTIKAISRTTAKQRLAALLEVTDDKTL